MTAAEAARLVWQQLTSASGSCCNTGELCTFQFYSPTLECGDIVEKGEVHRCGLFFSIFSLYSTGLGFNKLQKLEDALLKHMLTAADLTDIGDMDDMVDMGD